MPRGVPVATVAIGNAKNAGILAAKILGIENERLRFVLYIAVHAEPDKRSHGQGEEVGTYGMERLS